MPAFQQNEMPDAKLKFAQNTPMEPMEPLGPEELKKAESETPLHHPKTQQEVMLVDTVNAGDHRNCFKISKMYSTDCLRKILNVNRRFFSLQSCWQ